MQRGVSSPEGAAAGAVHLQAVRGRHGRFFCVCAALRGPPRQSLPRSTTELRKEHVQLNRDKRAKEAKIVELEKKAKDVAMLKFGQIIDLDVLDRLGTNKGSEDLKETLKKQEAKTDRQRTSSRLGRPREV